MCGLLSVQRVGVFVFVLKLRVSEDGLLRIGELLSEPQTEVM